MAEKVVKRSIAMSPQMHELLVQLAARREKSITESDLIREAIRQYLDEQADVVGSRRHFQRSLQERLDRMEETLTFQFNMLLYLMTSILEDEAAVADAMRAAKRNGPSMLAKIRTLHAQDTEPGAPS